MSDYTNNEAYQELLDDIDAVAAEHERGTDEYITEVEELLIDALETESFTAQNHHSDELVLESELFIGRHTGSFDGREFRFNEFGTYTLRGTDLQTEFVGDYEVIKKAERRQQESHTEQHASQTIGERNPGLGGTNRI